MSTTKFLPKLSAILIALIVCLPAIAQFEEGKETSNNNDLLGAAIIVGAKDSLMYSANTGEVSKKIKNIISLKFDEQSTTFF